MRQTPRQSVKDYVAVGRESLVRLREVEIENPSTLFDLTMSCERRNFKGLASE
jgi:hypothetical protein